ncbi:hypothetical protein CC86DRAFT_212437 [Ophiobolus disseminans]|uniref:F-box domain-containing protein n=1 Tax=Ophiobolus disseminans TaxID=1469910 RepID=A0A6A7A2I2_9PLEO|nr:hypothetical protein CC86DRAFT_212437 [Ophiobolus disseminans]
MAHRSRGPCPPSRFLSLSSLSFHDKRQSPNMPGLLDLPSELIWDIIGFVASSTYSPPPHGKRHRPDRLYGRAIICFPTAHHLWLNPTRRLLLVCRRLYAETSIYHSKMPKVLKLDVTVVNNHWIWPCWRYIPGGDIGYVLESLEINLIYCCTEEERGSYSMTTAAWTYEEDFVKMISQFLHSSPSSSSFGSSGMPWGRSDFRAKTLTINIDTATVNNGNNALSEYEVPFRHIEGLAHLTFDPLYSADLVACLRHIDWMRNRMYQMLHHANDGFTIRERVDQIVFSVDSYPRKKIDIAKYISEKYERRIAQYRQSKVTGSSS